MLRGRLLLVSALSVAAAVGPGHPNLDLDVTKGPNDMFHTAKISDDGMLQVYQKWFETGLSSLMAAVANKNLKRQRRSVSRRFGECSAGATDLPKHAGCLTRLLNNELHEESPTRKLPRFHRYRKQSVDQHAEAAKPAKQWSGAFRMRHRRSPKVQQADNYALNNNKKAMTPLGSVAKLLLESMKEAKNKTELPMWQDTVARIRANGAKRRALKKMIENDSEESMNQIALRGLTEQLAPQNGVDPNVDIQEMVDNPTKLQAFLKERRKKKQKPEEKVVDLIRQGMKLTYSLTGQNTTNFDNRTMRLMSPKFLSVSPEEKQQDDISLVSPSLFALHDQGEGIENLTSLPTLLKGLGLKDDQQIWLDVIMEAAGVNDQSEKMEEDMNNLQFNKTRSIITDMKSFVDKDGTPLYATKDNITELGGDTSRIDLFERLHTSYSKDQLREMNTTGYAILNNEQLQMLYGEGSPTADPHAYETFMNLTEDEIHERIHGDLKIVSEMDNFQLKQRDLVLSPVAFLPVVLNPALASQPFILSPIIFTPVILSPAIWGAVVLSPWMFVPLVLAPRILGSLILSPFIFSPLILTPVALHPVILSPGMFNPLVLSPLLLTPLILSPLIFTPMILNPLCLSPIILTPTLASPLVLSPFVLTPIIASPLILSALVLSPYALSPVLFSPLIAFAAILSPSWLS